MDLEKKNPAKKLNEIYYCLYFVLGSVNCLALGEGNLIFCCRAQPTLSSVNQNNNNTDFMHKYFCYYYLFFF